MARIRSIKPELLEDEKTASLSHLEWRVFVSLLLLADDYGNFRATPGRVAGAALWAHDDDIGPVLQRLNDLELVRLYAVDGQRYGHVRGWAKHQKVDHPGKPSCPFPPVSRDPREESRDPRETVAPDLIGSDLKGSEMEREREGGIGAPLANAISGPSPSPPAPCAEPALWPAGTWYRKFGKHWTERYHLTHGGGKRTATACGDLDATLAGLPETERLDAQAKASAMFVAYLADPSADAAKHPFAWFVDRFDGLRADPQKRADRARGSPRRDPLADLEDLTPMSPRRANGT
jgi:hypothetical protein